MNKLRLSRIAIASILFIIITLLFADFTGSIHSMLGFAAKIQFIPALLSLNVVVIVALTLLTLIFGRLYCSVICPLGLFQDTLSRLASIQNKRRKFSYSKPLTWLRWSVIVLFVASFIAGIGSIVALLEPYSAYGRMASNLFAPIYKLGNNTLAYFAERADSYAFYSTDIILFSLGTLAVAIVTMVVVGYLAWRGGRTYCNTICPVGTLLGLLSRLSLLRVVVDQDKCNGCQKCVRSCKSSCITPQGREIDYSRCVVCFDCIDSCSQGAIGYLLRYGNQAKERVETKDMSDARESAKRGGVDDSKRAMLTISATLMTTSVIHAQGKLVDGGLAIIEDKKRPERKCPIVPPGAGSLRHFEQNCTGCQLCVSVCPNQVLQPRSGIINFMQPEMSYNIGYCRPECTKCSEVCPAGAISRIDRADKSSTQIGHAVLIEKNCVVLTDGVSCGNCARHCPVGAITMIRAKDVERYGEREIPIIDTERCIGCGACENLCPARPFSAIYVEGNRVHRTI